MLNAEKFRDEILSDELFEFNKAVLIYGDNCKEVFNYNNFIKWLLSEYRESILDEVEREYLSAVCRPYEVVSISKKISFDASIEWIAISVESSSNNGIELVYLPCFKSETMYEGMKVKKAYTPQELGIKCRNNPKGEIKHD